MKVKPIVLLKIFINKDLTLLRAEQTAERKDWKLHSIYKLPQCVTDLHKTAYKPRAISFGPYHHDAVNLKPMEVHKDRALLHFLRRSGESIDYYDHKLNAVVKDLRDAYDDLDPKWEKDSEAFVQLMIRDGSFMLEILRASDIDSGGGNDYVDNDPIFSNHGKLYMMPYIRRDMLMLENQLSMRLLDQLLSPREQTKNGEGDYINNLILQFCFPGSPPKDLGKCKHVLDVYRKNIIWEDPHVVKIQPRSSHGLSTEGCDIIPSASQLHEAGIVIKRNRTGSLKDISFHHGVLRLPEIFVDDTSEPVYLNLIAFERFHVDAGNEVTSYISFMDDIIDNAKDVSLLQDHEIIQNAVGSDEAVAQLFNSLSKDITLDPDSKLSAVRDLIAVQEKAIGYSKRHWNQWRANLIRTYFTSPWSLLSLLAAISLFGLTIVQTIYSVGQYYQC